MTIETAEEISAKINVAKNKFLEHSMTDLKAMHVHAFGVQVRGNNREKLAMKLAKWTVIGDGSGGGVVSTTVEPIPSVGTIDEQEKIAKGILSRIVSTWNSLEKIDEQKKTEISKIREVISKSRDEISSLISDDGLDPMKRLERIENHWRTLTQMNQKKAAVSKDYRDRIKSAKQLIKSEMENTKQLSLF